MPCAAEITSASEKDPVTILVATAGAFNGSPRFLVSRESDPATAFLTASSGSNPYLVAVPAPGLWYVWPADDDGPALTFSAVWLMTNLLVKYSDEVADKLQQILLSHRTGIDALIRTVHPEWSVQQVVVGMAGLIDRWPSIVISDNRFSKEYAAMPLVQRVEFFANIAFVAHHNTLPDEIKACLLGQTALTFILSQAHYREIVLQNNVHLTVCNVTEGRSGCEPETDGFYSYAQVEWSGEAQIQMAQ